MSIEWQRAMAARSSRRGGLVLVLIAALASTAIIAFAHLGWTQEKAPPAAAGQTSESRGNRLVEDLGCAVCHTLEGHTTNVRAEVPDLTYEGDKVRPEWLFAFLKSPRTLRPWLHARMANFRLSDREVLAITEYVRQELRDRAAPAVTRETAVAGADLNALAKAGARLASKEYLDCFSCHVVGGRKPDGPREGWAPDLTMAAARLNPDWIARWLRDPQKIQSGTKMPTYFTGPGSGPPDLLDGDEKKQVLALQAWLSNLGPASNPEDYTTAKESNPGIRPEDGRRLVQELNCEGCHRIPGLEPRKVAPVLSYAGSKFRRDWLIAFLRRPEGIRPAGHILGWRSRMPDFRLSDQEVNALVDYLMTLTYSGLRTGVVAEEDKALTRFQRFQASKVLEQTAGCIGCHRVKNSRGETVGGLSGPDLTEAGRRLRGDFIYNFVRSPRTFEPEGKMAVFGHFLSDGDAKIVAEYLGSLR